MLPTEIRRPIRRLNSTLNRNLNGIDVAHHSQQNPLFSGICRSLRNPRGLWLRVPLFLDRFRILEMALCDTTVMATISNWVRPSRDSLATICNIAGVIWRAMLWSCVHFYTPPSHLWFMCSLLLPPSINGYPLSNPAGNVAPSWVSQTILVEMTDKTLYGPRATQCYKELRGIFNGGVWPLCTPMQHWECWVVMINGSERTYFQTIFLTVDAFLIFFNFVRDSPWSYTRFYPSPDRLELGVDTRSCRTLQVANEPVRM